MSFVPSRAVEDERVRIAEELQVVVANGVSAMVVQAEAVPRVIAAGESERAAGSLALIEETGRDALAEMRRLLGVLRHDERAGTLEPQPTLAQAGRLVEQARARGLEVAVELEGERVALPAGIDLAVFRVLQETLSSAAGDGAKTATVVIAYGDDELALEIRDDRPAADSPAEALPQPQRAPRALRRPGARRAASRRSGAAADGAHPLGRSHRMSRLAERLRQVDDRVWDRALVAFLCTLVVLAVLSSTDLEGPLALNLLVGIAMTLPLLWRRRTRRLGGPRRDRRADPPRVSHLAARIGAVVFVLIVYSYSTGVHAMGPLPVPGSRSPPGPSSSSGSSTRRRTSSSPSSCSASRHG